VSPPVPPRIRWAVELLDRVTAAVATALRRHGFAAVGAVGSAAGVGVRAVSR
jgi:hypothetical protein